jgi:SAM-dependent methyltransferase
MNKKNSKVIHEEFHKNTTIQNKVINPNNFTYRLLFDVYNKYLENINKALDIGCGAGTITLYLASRGIDSLGLDISEKAINEATKSAKKINLKNVEFKVINFPKDIPTGKYDLILCFEVLEHLYNDELAIKKIYNLLNNNGKVIISVPSKNAPLYKIGYAKEFDERVGHLRRYSFEQLNALLEKNNFIILESRLNEGIMRNFLFLNPYAGHLVRGMRSILGDTFSFLDSISVKLFGESQIIIVAQKK